MSSTLFTPAPQLKFGGLPILDPKDAENSGYVPISNDVDLESETSIAHSMASGMRGIDAVWIRYGHQPGPFVLLARKKSELRTIKDEQVATA